MSKADKETIRIAVTMGDPAGVGPELCLHLMSRPIQGGMVPVVIGDAAVLERVAKTLNMEAPHKVLSLDDWIADWQEVQEPAVVQIDSIQADSVTPGSVSAETGQAAFEYIQTAIALTLVGQCQGVTTAPIHKEAFKMAEVPYPGHTEIFADRSHTHRYCMMLTAEEMTCTFATLHMGYHEVPEHLSKERILEVIELTHDAMTKIRGQAPRLTVLGLNPHAGEHGMFGKGEEEDHILPAIEAACEKGIQAEGPLPPDTAFLPDRMANTDAFVCMYHDQGHIPLKMIAFDRAVNVTLGLRMVRTSVGHGTALDVAWQGKASPNSMFQAVDLAVKLVAQTKA